MTKLAEIPESAATGSTAELYADIRRVVGVPFVVLIYRSLAVEPGRMEAIWAELAPNLASEEGLAARAAVERASLTPAGLPRPEPIDPGALDAAGIGSAAFRATLAGFRRANAANAIALWALLDGVAGTRPAPAGQVPAAAAPVPAGAAMADLAALPASTVALLEEMSAPLAGDERPVVVPSLIRYLAHDEALLRAVWGSLRPVVEDPGFPGAVAAVRDLGRELSATLPHRVTPLADPEARATVERFLRAVPTMLVVGPLLGEITGSGDGRRPAGR